MQEVDGVVDDGGGGLWRGGYHLFVLELHISNNLVMQCASVFREVSSFVIVTVCQYFVTTLAAVHRSSHNR